MNTYQNCEQLKKLLLSQAGFKRADKEACEKISILIFLRNRDYVSRSTLMRFFGLIAMDENDMPPVILAMLERFAEGIPEMQ